MLKRLRAPVAALILVVLGLLLTGCGAQDTRIISSVLAEAEKNEGVAVKLLGSQRLNDGTLVFYQFKRQNVCGSGAGLRQPGKDIAWLREDHSCAQADPPFTFNRSGPLGPYHLTYGLIFDQRVAKVTVSLDQAPPVEANRHGGAWWLLQGAAQPQRIQVQAYDARGNSLGATGSHH